MPPLSDLLASLALVTRPGKAAAWDPVGMQLGDPANMVHRVAVCHEITEAVADRLVEERPELVITYHPLLFRPTTSLVAGRTAGGRAWRLARAGVAVAVTHTDFDAAPGGPSDALADALGLERWVPFGPVAPADHVKVVVFVPGEAADAVMEAMAAAGAGRIGNYDRCSFRTPGQGTFGAGEGTAPVTGEAGGLNLEDEMRLEMLAPRRSLDGVLAALAAAHPYEEPAFDVVGVESNHGFIGRVGSWRGNVAALARAVGEILGATGMRLAGDPAANAGRVAVLPGSGGSFLVAARAAGAQAVVTGDVDHHRAVAAVDSGLAVVDPGHAATERPGMSRLVEVVSGLNVEVIDLTGETGPWVDVSASSLP